jgi:hypothetical protein
MRTSRGFGGLTHLDEGLLDELHALAEEVGVGLVEPGTGVDPLVQRVNPVWDV